MKKRIVLIIVLMSVITLINAQNWQWANSGGGPSGDYSNNICTDKHGNVYISGSIMSSPVYFHTDTLTTNGFNDCFIAKYDIDGNEIWVKRFGGPNTYMASEGSPGICFDTVSNYLYLVGSFVTSCSLDTIILTTGIGDRQIVIAKFDPDGHCKWAKSAGGIGSDNAGIPIITEDGSLIFTGDVQYWGDFDTISIPSGGFIAKYDSSGNCIWAKKMFTGCGNGAFALYNSDIFALGINNDTIVGIDTLTIIAPSSRGKFLARFDSLCNIKWVRFFGGPDNYTGGDMVTDKLGNCYFSGVFSGSYSIFGNDTIFSEGYTEYYLAKYDRNGNKKWIRQAHATASADGEGIALDASNNILLTGSFTDTIHFDSNEIVASGGQDMFVARYDSSGNFMNVVHQGYGEGNDITCDVNGAVLITGDFMNSIDFGSTTLESHGSLDAFVAKLTSFTNDTKEFQNPNNGLLIYANPTTGKCNITVPDEFLNEEQLVLCIYNLNGQLIQKQQLVMSDNKISLSLEQEAKGVYTATLSNGKKVYTGKIVFE
jgi:hypothetical protein